MLPLLAAVAVGQQDDVPLPPRLDDAPVNRPARSQTPAVPLVPTGVAPARTAAPAARTPASAAAVPLGRSPDRARLAPLPEERAGETEEIIVLGGDGWRLPDLGSAWREEQAAEQPGRIQTTLLPLYDPENPTVRPDLFLLNREVSRIGYIDLFRVRFGRRTLPE